MRRAARLLLLVGAVAVGALLLRSAPRDVTLVYDLSRTPGVTRIEVDIRRGGQEVRHSELRFPGGAPAQVRHPVRLPDGDYQLALRLVGGPGGPLALRRDVEVRESGPIVLPLGP